jgi:hypothetical protein
MYYIFKKKTYKHNNNNDEKLRPDRLGPDCFGAGKAWGRTGLGPKRLEINIYYIDRWELWGFIREIKSGINIFFSAGVL